MQEKTKAIAEVRDLNSVDTSGQSLEPVPTFRQDVRDNRFQQYPFTFIKAKGEPDSTMACFQMLCKHLNIPFKRDVIHRLLENQINRTGRLSLEFCGAVAQILGLNAQLTVVPVRAVARLETPALVQWHGNTALLYEANEQELVFAMPNEGVIHCGFDELFKLWGAQREVLLLKATEQTPQQRFGFQWFFPSVQKYRRVLAEIFIASFFVQLFALANPLMVQVIIDKVIVQGSVGTLHLLGGFLVLLAVFEAVLSSLRTFLFVDTTNRIDLDLSSKIIDHLLRLPLRYYERHAVGELATRINELENVRQFLTGTALTVALDTIFSVIYIIILFKYNWWLALVALAVIPFFIALGNVVSPLIRNQLRFRAERNADAQSYLVEIVSGIQTVKAQNIELRSRWEWQRLYARYVSAGFKTVLTSTTAASTSNFLNELSSLLVLWVGAFLVLQHQLTLGELIAFRIIAGYVTNPLLRLAQAWQNFQEVSLSLERLADIVNAPTEVSELDHSNISMPLIEGRVQFENVSFRFEPTGPMQLSDINLEFPSGVFVGVVGESGSGKSTLVKLLPRLYPLESGRIFVDDYDISKVELYSLRQQIGIVPQDTLLFDGTVQENIALNCPDASQQEVINAAKVAVAHDFIMGLPNGYNTRVGERGSRLSGGQRQRIAIARTVLQNPRLLILDEATSALDYTSERQVCLNLAKSFEGRTVFFITHRLSTIRNADVILVMSKGIAVEQGNHEELMAIKRHYYNLYNQQEDQR